MRDSKKVKELEREIEDLRLKVYTLEEGLKNAEVFINNIKNNPYSGPVNHAKPEEVSKESGDNYDDSDDSVPLGVKKVPASSTGASHSNRTNNIPLIVIDDIPPNNNNTANDVTTNQNNTANDVSTNQNNTANENEEIILIEDTTGKSNTESWIGKILMGFLASLLVFIALVTFAKVLLPYITDTIKIILMFVVSIIITATGFIFRQKKENIFTNALLACGSTCIYISILVTGIYFKAISSIVMYILIGIWAILNIFFKKNIKDWLFFAIGNLGYLISIIFSIGQNDATLIIPMLIYMAMISVVYLIMHWKNEPQRHTQNVINVISIFAFQVIVSDKYEKIIEINIVGAVAIAFSFIGFIAYIASDLFKYKAVHFYIAGVNTIVFILSYFFFVDGLYMNKLYFITFIVISIPAIVLEMINIYWKIKKLADVEIILNAVFSGFIFAFATSFIIFKKHFIIKYGIIMIVHSLIIIYGYIKKEVVFKIQGWALVLFCMFSGVFFMMNLTFCIISIILTASFLVVEAVVYNDSENGKIFNYCLLQVWIFIIGLHVKKDILIDNDYDAIINIVTFGIMAILNVVMILIKFYKMKDKEEEEEEEKNKEDEGKNIHVLLDILNLIFMVNGGKMMILSNDYLFKILYLVIVVFLACINLPVKDKGSRERYLYAAIKFAVIIYFSFCIFEAPNFVISICMIAYSVVCVAFGFKNRLLGKFIRVFGLVMTLIFVFKFIVIDINYDSSVMKAVSYLVSGILCFGISAIYSYFERKQKKTNENE